MWEMSCLGKVGVFNLLGLNRGAGQGGFLSPGVSPVLGLSSTCPAHAQCFWTPFWMSPASFWWPNPTAPLEMPAHLWIFNFDLSVAPFSLK